MSKTTDPEHPVRGCLGWAFSRLDDLSIERARRSAAKYMQNYGKGSTPYQIDLTHYANIHTKINSNGRGDTSI